MQTRNWLLVMVLGCLALGGCPTESHEPSSNSEGSTDGVAGEGGADSGKNDKPGSSDPDDGNDDGNGDEPVSNDGGTIDPVPGDGGGCATGFEQGSPQKPTRECAATYGGQCFESDAAACACAGCEQKGCLIAKSYPTQISCAQDEPDACDAAFVRDAEGEARACNFVVNDLCFVDGDAACECACGASDCLVLESYPAQIRCGE